MPWGTRANGMFSSLPVGTLEGREVGGPDGEGGRWKGLSLGVVFFCSRCTTAPAPELCRNPSTAPLPTSSPTPRPRGSCPVGQESLSCGSNHGAVISVGKSLRKSSWYRRERTACSVPPRRTTPPSAQRGARVAAGSGGGLCCISLCRDSPAAGQGREGILRAREVPCEAGRFQQLPSLSRARRVFPRTLEKGSRRAPLRCAVSMLV